MMAHVLYHAAFWCAVVPCVLFVWNLYYFRRPPLRHGPPTLPCISVLIPARNEEANIAAAVQCVLASEGVDLELIVLDDASIDGTAQLVDAIHAQDARVRCVFAPPLAPGWAGKAHAAHALSRLAAHQVLCFLDADVRIAPETLARMHAFLRSTHSDLVSGFPQEITITPLEWLLLPLIHFVLLSYLPFAGLRHTNLPAFGSGCGQFLMMTRKGYDQTRGYAGVRSTMHDGLMLAKLFRASGLHTDVADLTGFASCRMYNSVSDVWSGLSKNATEGIASPGRILPFTVLLVCGQLLPWPLLAYALYAGDPYASRRMALACAASLLPRIISVFRFRQKAISAILHPVGIATLLILQWCALVRKARGVKANWRGRAFDLG